MARASACAWGASAEEQGAQRGEARLVGEHEAGLQRVVQVDLTAEAGHLDATDAAGVGGEVSRESVQVAGGWGVGGEDEGGDARMGRRGGRVGGGV